jgi:hypothetical protein
MLMLRLEQHAARHIMLRHAANAALKLFFKKVH